MLPNEAEMPLKNFGAKQIRDYALAVLAEIFVGDASPDIAISEDGALQVRMGYHEFFATKNFDGTWFLTPVGHKALGAVVQSPFDVITYIVKMKAKYEMDEFLAQTYDVSA